jgi:hypothetical protein
MLNEPLDPHAAKALILAILQSGGTVFSRHALHEMATDRFGEITRVDVVNVLRGGVVEPAELEKGTWRYRVRTAKIYVVVAFLSETELIVVTAWRTGR